MCFGWEDPKDLERRIGIARRQQERERARKLVALESADEAARRAVEGEAA